MLRRSSTKKEKAPKPEKAPKAAKDPKVATPKKATFADEYTAFLAISVVALVIGLTLCVMESSRLTEQLGNDPVASAPRI
jgi:hypothetical protein